VLAETDYAAKTLQQNTSYITDLEAQTKATEKELRKLHALTEDERKDHVKYRDSTFKRYAHKLGGRKGEAKFASKSEKEEREFLEAWQKEREAEERQSELRRALATANEDRQRFESEKARNESAQRDLDQLYASIFSGPTPDLPGEDQLETAVQYARQHLEQVQSQCNADCAALDALGRTESRMQNAAKAMEEALHSSRLDMWVGGSFADVMERDALSQAAVGISDMGHMISDVMFDNIFSDMAQHDRIHASNNQLMEAMAQLKEQIALQTQRTQSAKLALNQGKASMEEARVELQNIRAEAFGRVAGGGVSGGSADGVTAPPPYVPMEGSYGQQPRYSAV
jgi:chromosome segregation ATPase